MARLIPQFLEHKPLLGIVRSTDIDRRYIGLRWFPFQDCASDTYRKLLKLEQNPLAPFVAIDSETPLMPGDLWNIMEGEIAYMRYKDRFSESDLRIFGEIPAYSQGRPGLINQMQMDAEAQLTERIETLSQSIDGRVEWMCLNAMTGLINYSSVGTYGNVQIKVIFPGNFIGSTEDHNKRVSATTKWDQSSPTPIKDLVAWRFDVGDVSGVLPSVMVCSSKAMMHFCLAQEVRELLAAQTATGVTPPVVGQTAAVASLAAIGINEVIVYDAKYTTRTEAAGSATRTKTRFLDEKDILLLPDTPLGNMMTAPAQPNDWNTGKFSWRKEQEDPWVIEVGAGLYAFPFMANNQHQVLQATVLT